MEEKLLKLEKSLFKYEYMSNLDYLNNIIDDRYEEVGKSGKKFSKNDVINELSSIKSDRNITIYNFICNEIDKNVWLVHYITLDNNNKIYRTSIWKQYEDSVKIIFHQASQLIENIELLKY